MEILKEWFVWGESDLFLYGIGIVIFSALLPCREAAKRKNCGMIACLLVIYAICESVVTLWPQNWFYGFLCLFLGGIALSAAIGRILRMAWQRIRK